MARLRDSGSKPPKKGLSRRAFLSTGAGLAMTAPALTGMGLPVPAGAAADVPILGPDGVSITLTVNGKPYPLTVEPRVTLFEAIHDRLELTGTKNACDRGTCGACTVIMDGNVLYSCSVLALEAQGKKIVTVEGLSVDGKPHPIQKAFVENDALQCGFCTSGFVVACKDFLDKHPAPTMAQAEKGLGGNLCRCGTYVGIRQAVLSAAKAMKGGPGNA